MGTTSFLAQIHLISEFRLTSYTFLALFLIAMPRIYCPQPIQVNQTIVLTDAAARHVQVLRHQPGDKLTLFNGGIGIGGEFEVTVLRMGRSDVEVQVVSHSAVEREASLAVHLAVGMPANERMDWLVEKATELGVNSIQPLMTERSVLRLSGERATKKVAHWQSIAVAACEQCGRNQVPTVHPILTIAQWLKQLDHSPPSPAHRLVLSLHEESGEWRQRVRREVPVTFLSGPEGGLSAAEEASACSYGFVPASLGPRVLRAETAALVALSSLTLD